MGHEWKRGWKGWNKWRPERNYENVEFEMCLGNTFNIVGTHGGLTRKLGNWVGKLGITLQTIFLQNTALLGTKKISRKVLDT